jgi:hypothetical protein
MSCLSHIYRSEGVAGLWRGNLLNVIRIAPQGAIAFVSKDFYQQLVPEQHRYSSPGLAAASMMSGPSRPCPVGRCARPLACMRLRWLNLECNDLCFHRVLSCGDVQSHACPCDALACPVLGARARAGATCMAAVYPLDLVRGRMTTSPGVYKSWIEALALIPKNEGKHAALL